MHKVCLLHASSVCNDTINASRLHASLEPLAATMTAAVIIILYCMPRAVIYDSGSRLSNSQKNALVRSGTYVSAMHDHLFENAKL